MIAETTRPQHGRRFMARAPDAEVKRRQSLCFRRETRFSIPADTERSKGRRQGATIPQVATPNGCRTAAILYFERDQERPDRLSSQENRPCSHRLPRVIWCLAWH